MKKLIYLLLLPLALAVAACGGKNGSSNKESVLARQDSVDAHGLQRMQSSKAETDIKFKGRDYHSLVSRTPDESLPHVSNDMGDTYVDNKIVLRITRGSENVLNKTFTKNDFSSVVDAKFLSKSILEESYMTRLHRRELSTPPVCAIRRPICMFRFPSL